MAELKYGARPPPPAAWVGPCQKGNVSDPSAAHLRGPRRLPPGKIAAKVAEVVYGLPPPPPEAEVLTARPEPKAAVRRQRSLSDVCLGHGDVCVYSLAAPLAPARVQPWRGQTRCAFYDPELLPPLAGGCSGARLRTILGKLASNNPDALNAAFAVVEEALGNDAVKFEAVLPAQVQWERALGRRKSIMALPTEAEKTEYGKWAQDDRRRREKKFPGLSEAASSGWMTSLGQAFEDWALKKSWTVCRQCSRVEKAPFYPSRVVKKPRWRGPYVPRCKFCKSGVGYPTVQPDDVPEPLRGLSLAIVEALRPLEIDSGIYQRASDGYRVHSDVTRFRWQEEAVDVRVRRLPREEKTKARKALEWLLGNAGTCFYKTVFDKHNAFLRRAAAAGEQLTKSARRLPVNVMETVGLECAVWPHLYWNTEMCETFVRSQDARRLARGHRDQLPHRRGLVAAGRQRAEARKQGRRKAAGQRRARAPLADGSASDSEAEVLSCLVGLVGAGLQLALACVLACVGLAQASLSAWARLSGGFCWVGLFGVARLRRGRGRGRRTPPPVRQSLLLGQGRRPSARLRGGLAASPVCV